MAIRKPKPTSPGRRFVTYPDFAEITRDRPEKSLTEGLKKSGGRNSNGRKTSRHRGGGAKRLYRVIDFKRRKDGIPARVAQIEYDPNRSAYIALINYVDGEKRYILAPARLRVGAMVQSGPDADIRVGNCLPLANMPARTRRPARPLRRDEHPAAGQGRRSRDAAPALGRDAAGSSRMPRDRRHDRQRRPPERQDRQGGAQAPHGRPAPDSRHGDEPGRPPARRRRRIDDGRAPPRDSVGRAHARLPHAQKGQRFRPLHRPWTQTR